MRHIDFNDYLNYKLLEEPLSCNCEDCLKKFKIWEEEREKFKNFESDFFFKKQENIIFKRLRKNLFPYKPIFAFAFSLIIIFGFFFFLNLNKSSKIENFDLEYSKLSAFYEKPVLGDLEACSIIFEANSEEEDI